ncbi:hypothetical protein HPB50_000814 [Hyalomma asiaticum]|uniref:Uncharacterized protein n=1 Tax=Hyalomma asiaticum TaxID=266040 RepID=A0ACB7SLF1_HYAAI|nr:hypothetical protein HPB50_000814 [Hyalomma asiaticum]
MRIGVTASGEMDIFKIAELADRLMTVTKPAFATVLTEASSCPALLEIREEIPHLADTFAALQANKSQGTPRPYNQRRARKCLRNDGKKGTERVRAACCRHHHDCDLLNNNEFPI